MGFEPPPEGWKCALAINRRNYVSNGGGERSLFAYLAGYQQCSWDLRFVLTKLLRESTVA